MKKTSNGILGHIIGFFNNDENFRLVFISSFFFASLCLIRDFFYVAAGITMIWAAYLVGYKFIYKKMIFRVRNRSLIYLFIGLATLTCILHCRHNFFRNMYIVCYMLFCFLFFYGIHAGRSKNSCRREVCALLDYLNAVTTIIMLAGLILLAIFPSGFKINGDSFAIHENRFVGILFNANVTAFYALMSIIFCNILWVMKKAVGKLHKKQIILYSICIFINSLALILTDSNDSLLLLIVYLWFIFFYVIFKGCKASFMHFLLRFIALIIAGVLIAAVLLTIRTLVQQGVAFLFSLSKPVNTTSPPKIPGTEVTPPPAQSTPTTFEHQNTNIDSGRFVIWKQSLGLFRLFPIFGVGKENIVEFGKYYLGGLKYGDFHNGLITIIISYGLAGFFTFMIFAITIAKSMLKAIFRYRNENRKDGRVLMYLTAFCSAYCAYSMFEVALLVDLSYRILIFWLLIGLAISYVNSYEHSAVLAHENIPDRSRSIYRIANYRHSSG